MKYLIAVLLLGLSGCGSSRANEPITVQTLRSPDGSTCYAIVQDGQVRGGNCR